MQCAKRACLIPVLSAVIGKRASWRKPMSSLRNHSRASRRQMHSATIRAIAVDAGERPGDSFSGQNRESLGSRSGNLLEVIRPPEGDGNVGKLYAVAITPDGATIALGGFRTDSTTVYLFDRASGRLAREIDGLPKVVHHLCYSPDGRLLAIGLAGANGIRVYRTSDYQEAARDFSMETLSIRSILTNPDDW